MRFYLWIFVFLGLSLTLPSPSVAADGISCDQEAVLLVAQLGDIGPSCKARGEQCFSDFECCGQKCDRQVCQGGPFEICTPNGQLCMTDQDCCSSNCSLGVCKRSRTF